MHGRCKWAASAMWLVAFVLLMSGLGSAGEIEPELASKLAAMDGNEYVRVIVRMEERPVVTTAMGPDLAQFTLQETARRTQKPVVAFFEELQVSGDVKAFNSFWLVNVAFAEIRADKVAALASLPGVGLVYEDFEISIPEVELYSDVDAQALRWDHVAAVFAPDVWNLGYEGQGITVAVADTGVDVSHPELAGAMGGEPPFYDGYWAEFDEDGFIVPGSVPHDLDGHGTHVSGTVAGRNIRFQMGVAPKVTLAHAQVLPEGTGTFPQIIGGLQWAVEQGFDIINGSLGASGIHPELAEATDNIMAAGVVPVFANGNLGLLSTPPSAPGNTPAAIAVGAYDMHGEEAEFNRGDIIEYPGYEYDAFSRIKPDISAPGVDILSAYLDGNYAYGEGTSMASPHVAGVVALMLSANPNLTVDEVKEILFSTTGGHQEMFGWEDIPTKDIHFGWGRINGYRAVLEARSRGLSVLVNGKVVSEEGPIHGATVTFEGPRTYVFTTDSTGSYTGVVDEGFYTITAAATAYSPQSRTERLIKTDDPVELSFVLKPAPPGAAAGAVTEADSGEPLAGVEVFVQEADIRTTTGEDGIYTLALPEGVFAVGFEKPGYFPVVAESVIIVPEQTAQVDATLTFGHRSLVGTVRDLDGEPAAGAVLRVLETGDETMTDDKGAFALDLPAGAYTLAVSKPGLVSTTVEAVVVHGRVTTADVELAFDAGALEGKVTSFSAVAAGGGDGSSGAETPLAGAIIRIPALDMETTSASDGAYKFDRVPAGRWQVVAEAEEHFTQSITVVIERDETMTLDIVLQAVEDAVAFQNSFDTPEEQAVWQFVDLEDNGGWFFTQRESVSGSFSAWHGDEKLADERRGPWYPYPQGAEMISPPFVVPEGEVRLSFYMRGGLRDFHTMQVFLRDPDTGEQERVFQHGGPGHMFDWRHVTVDVSKFAGQNVSLVFLIRSWVNPPCCNYQGMFIDDVLVDYTYPEVGGTIRGVVTDEDGAAIPGAAVTIVELQPQGEFTRMSQTTTKEDGTYEIAAPAGGWTVHVAKAPEFAADEATVYVAPNRSAAAHFTLERNTPPAKVAGLRAEPGDGLVRLTWDANEEDDLMAYYVYRSLDGEQFHRIGATDETFFVAEQLQNGYTYYFRVSAVDAHGLEGEAAEVEAVPLETLPTVRSFDVKPRALRRGGSFVITAELNHPAVPEATFEVTVEAELAGESVQQWTFVDVPVGHFEAVVDATDVFGRPWAPNIYQITLQATDEAGYTAATNPVNVAVLAPLPQALSFVLGNNPFNPTEESQRIEYSVPADGQVTVAVYTLDGRRVRTLFDGTRQPGDYITFWDGADDAGRVVLGGMYVVRVQFVDADGQRTELTRHSVVVK